MFMILGYAVQNGKASSYAWLLRFKSKLTMNIINNSVPRLHDLHFNYSIATSGQRLPYLTEILQHRKLSLMAWL